MRIPLLPALLISAALASAVAAPLSAQAPAPTAEQRIIARCLVLKGHVLGAPDDEPLTPELSSGLISHITFFMGRLTATMDEAELAQLVLAETAAMRGVINANDELTISVIEGECDRLIAQSMNQLEVLAPQMDALMNAGTP